MAVLWPTHRVKAAQQRGVRRRARRRESAEAKANAAQAKRDLR